MMVSDADRISEPRYGAMNPASSRAAHARKEALALEAHVVSMEARDYRNYSLNQTWTDEHQDTWDERRAMLDNSWDHATSLSLDAGRNFKDRDGKMVELQRESIAAVAVSIYLASTKHNWKHVTGYRSTIYPITLQPES